MESRTIYTYDKPSSSVLPQHVDLNNFYLSPFQHAGLSYLTVEHFYQAHKYPKGSPTFEAVRTAPTPNQAKRLTRVNAYDKDWWEGAKDGVMAQAISLKYEQCPELLERLLCSWDCVIVEDSLQDPYWGGRLPGSKNRLGQTLMDERERRRKGLERVPVPALAWLMRPCHPLFPPPVPTKVQALEAIISQNAGAETLETALTQHPLFSRLTAASVQELITSEATYLTIPPGHSQDSIFPLIFVLSGSGEMETSSRFAITEGMWVSRSGPGVYFTGESELKVAEVKLEKAVAFLSRDTSREDFCSQAICSTMGHFQTFRSTVKALAAGQLSSPTDLITALGEAWPQFLTPETTLESLLYLPITTATVRIFRIQLNPSMKSPHFYQFPNKEMVVNLPPAQLEQFCFHLSVFLELRKRLHSEAIPGRIVEELQQHAPEALEELTQSEGGEVELRVERVDVEWKQVFSEYGITSADVVIGDLDNMRSVFSPYLQLISSTAQAFTASCYPSAPAKSLFYSLRFYLLVNPEQSHRAQLFDSHFGIYSLPNALILTPAAQLLLGLQSPTSSSHLICLSSTGGLETAQLIQELGAKTKTVRVIEKSQYRLIGQNVGVYRSEEGKALQCAEEGIMAFVQRESGYLTDPLTAKCMEILPKDAMISRLSGDIFANICEIAQSQTIEMKGFVPHSEQEELALLESWKISPTAENVIFMQFGPISDQLSALYEAAYSYVSPSHSIGEILTPGSGFPYEIPLTDISKVTEDAQAYYRRQSDHRRVLWSHSQLQSTLRRLPIASKVLIFSDIQVPDSLFPENKAAISCFSTVGNAEWQGAMVFLYTAGQWQSLDASISLHLALGHSLS
jgi:hypothetical protein